jgi:hypothetical protein
MNLVYGLDRNVSVMNSLLVKQKYIHEIHVTGVSAVCDAVCKLWFIDVKGILNDAWYSYFCETDYVVSSFV